MGFLKFLKRDEAPRELPNLAFDDLRNQLQANQQPAPVQKETSLPSQLLFPVAPRNLQLAPVAPVQTNQAVPAQESAVEAFKPLPTSNTKFKTSPPVNQELEIKQDISKHMGAAKHEKSFFKDMLQDLNEETKTVEQLDEWYQKKFMGNDVVSQMKEYYEKQKPEMMIRNVGSELKIKVKEKTQRLHELEQQWQEAYLQLLNKEEEIRKEEEHLKKIIAEFVAVCEKHLGKNKKDHKKE